MPAARADEASRKTSRGWTTLRSSVPTVSTAVRMRRCFVSSRTMPNCSTGRAPNSGSRYMATSPGVSSCGRSAGCRSSVRRPSSTAARTCAAFAAPTPGVRRSLVAGAPGEPVEASRGFEHEVGKRQGSRTPRPGPEDEGQQFVVAERGHARGGRASPGAGPARPAVSQAGLQRRQHVGGAAAEHESGVRRQRRVVELTSTTMAPARAAMSGRPAAG